MCRECDLKPRGFSCRYKTVDEAERAHLVELDDGPVPFGYANDQWEQMKDRLVPGDEIALYRTKDFGAVVIIRDGRPVYRKYRRHWHLARGHYVCLWVI